MQAKHIISAGAAFLLWGGWAFYVNSQVSLSSGLISGVAQGLSSFVMTLVMVRSIEFWMTKFEGKIQEIAWPVLITTASSACVLIIVHSLARTPDIITTIVPTLAVAFLFCIAAAFNSHKTIVKKSFKGSE